MFQSNSLEQKGKLKSMTNLLTQVYQYIDFEEL